MATNLTKQPHVRGRGKEEVDSNDLHQLRQMANLDQSTLASFLESIEKLIPTDAGLGANHPQGGTLDKAMCRHGQGSHRAIRFAPPHLDVFVVSNQLKAE
jgi:hypothetical protein